MRPWPEESEPTWGSAGWGWGCRLPAPGPQGAQHWVQWLEGSLLLQPKALPRYQPELKPLKQLGHNDLHLHLWGEREGGHEKEEGKRRGEGDSSRKVRDREAEETREGEWAREDREGERGRGETA